MENNIIEIVTKIYNIRNTKVMLDRDLAELYGIEPKRKLEDYINGCRGNGWR